MRNPVVSTAAAIIAGICLLAPDQASAAPPPLADHAASSKALDSSLVEKVRGRQVYVRRKVKYKRRYDWTYSPYWRPYQYHYWQYIYPYGGPLF